MAEPIGLKTSTISPSFLERGATDGWVPYPFLDPSLGYGALAITAVVLALAVVAFGVGVWALSRLRPLRVRSPATSK